MKWSGALCGLVKNQCHFVRLFYFQMYDCQWRHVFWPLPLHFCLGDFCILIRAESWFSRVIIWCFRLSWPLASLLGWPSYERGPYNQPLKFMCQRHRLRQEKHLKHLFSLQKASFSGGANLFLKRSHLPEWGMHIYFQGKWRGCIILLWQMIQTLCCKLHLAGRRCSGMKPHFCLAFLLFLGWGWELEDGWVFT